mmetsp:Transcript_34688/g.62979  ORF Transcript_34688/g.62979 Transcript_34688/m.62979 type:complete len:216 (+) Transcript_34688:890-1537(+)
MASDLALSQGDLLQQGEDVAQPFSEVVAWHIGQDVRGGPSIKPTLNCVGAHAHGWTVNGTSSTNLSWMRVADLRWSIARITKVVWQAEGVEHRRVASVRVHDLDGEAESKVDPGEKQSQEPGADVEPCRRFTLLAKCLVHIAAFALGDIHCQAFFASKVRVSALGSLAHFTNEIVLASLKVTRRSHQKGRMLERLGQTPCIWPPRPCRHLSHLWG